jgi:hypothetical protein
MRKNVTAKDAERYLDLVLRKLCVWEELYGKPKIVADWDGRGHYAICWDGPNDWAALAGDMEYTVKDPEFGVTLPRVEIPDSLRHVLAEPYDGCTLVLYLA